MESIFTAKNDEGIVANLQQCKGYELRFMIRHLKQNIKGKNIRSIEKKDAKIIHDSQKLISEINDFTLGGKNKKKLVEHLSCMLKKEKKKVKTIWNLSRKQHSYD